MDVYATTRPITFNRSRTLLSRQLISCDALTWGSTAIRWLSLGQSTQLRRKSHYMGPATDRIAVCLLEQLDDTPCPRLFVRTPYFPRVSCLPPPPCTTAPSCESKARWPRCGTERSDQAIVVATDSQADVALINGASKTLASIEGQKSVADVVLRFAEGIELVPDQDRAASSARHPHLRIVPHPCLNHLMRNARKAPGGHAGGLLGGKT
ncbi:hypothetical protein ABMB68_008643 [Bradyrhizobium sp. RT4a]